MQLLLVPLYLNNWSTELYGEWLTLSALATYLVNLDFGMNMATVNLMTQAYSVANLDEYKTTRNTALSFYFTIAIAGTIFLLAILILIPIKEWLGIIVMNSLEVKLTSFFLGSQILWMLPIGLIFDTYRTVGDLATSQWIRNSIRFITLISTVIALVTKQSVPLIASLRWLALILVLLYVLIDSKMKLVLSETGTFQVEFKDFKKLILPGWHFFLITVSTAMTEQGSVLLISKSLGGSAVTLYNTVRTLVNLIRQVVSIIAKAFWPDLTAAEKRHEYEQLRFMFRFIVGISVILTSGYGAFLLIYGMDVLSIWTQSKITTSQLFISIMVIYKVLQSTWLSNSILPTISNKNKILSRSYIFSSVIGLIISSLILEYYGILAFPISFILAEGLTCYHFVVKDACRIAQLNYYSYALHLWCISIISLACATFIAQMSKYLLPLGGITQWFFISTLIIMFLSVCVWFFWLKKSDRILLISKFWKSSKNILIIKYED